MSQAMFELRPYRSSEQDQAFALWQRAWQLAYPQIDFSQRIAWFRDHWRTLQIDSKIVVAYLVSSNELAGFVVVSPRTGYLDQIVVAPETQRTGVGKALIDAAKQIAPTRLYLHVNKDNTRAIAFYERCDFIIAGEDVNSRSGAPVYVMAWPKTL